jgi:hypothetical protein
MRQNERMNASDHTNVGTETSNNANSFDLFRISKSKEAVDISPNTIRKFARQGGLRIYRRGKNSFASKIELRAFLTRPASDGIA